MTQTHPTRLSRLSTSDYGCTRPLAGLGCISILLGSLIVGKWDQLHLIARVGGVILIVFGVVCISPLIALWTLRFWVKRFARKIIHGITHMNEDETLRNQALYANDLDYRPATDGDFRGIERSAYEQTTSALAKAGWRVLGDVVNAKAIEISVLRLMISPDGQAWLMIFREASSQLDNAPLTIDIASEFLDATFCCVSNSPAISLRHLPPQLRMNACDADTAAGDMVQQQEELRKRLTSSEALRFVTLADVLASQQRKYALTAGFEALFRSNDAAST